MSASPGIRVRLTDQLMTALDQTAKKSRKNYSQIVRESLVETLNIKQVTPMPHAGRPSNSKKLSK
jgi:predicted transcriptional regulator